MGDAAKMALLERIARARQSAAWYGVVVFSTLCTGCTAHFLGISEPEPLAQEGRPQGIAMQPTAAPATKNSAGTAPIQRVAFHHPNHPAPPEKKDEDSANKLKITLPMAIELCVNNNFRVRAGEEKTRQAEADLITSSLIPNPSLFTDCQLIPLQRTNVENQLGPSEWDTLVSIPLDWLLFGKRLAAMRATRLGIEVSNADTADVLRLQLSQTVDAFYEVLADEGFLELAEKYLADLQDLQKVIEEMVKAKKAGPLELDRIKLAVHEALLERHDRELALDLARAKLRPLIGRTAADPDYEVTGDLSVTTVVPPPKLEDAVALAEAHRPDLISDLKAIDQGKAAVELERRRARPQVAIQPGWSYYDQKHMNGFRNGSMFDIGIATTLPITDRNQGNIRKAQAQVRERQFTYHGDRADALADVESSLASYSDAVEHLTQFNTPETLQAADDLRKNMEAAYRAGDRKLIELLDAMKAYQDRHAHVIEFKSVYWRTLNKLNASVGLKAYDLEKTSTQPVGKEPDR
jgi:cobalt-zinc-cadmium efflux system outer membrane protein